MALCILVLLDLIDLSNARGTPHSKHGVMLKKLMGCKVCKVCKCKCKSYPDAKISCTQSSTDTSTPEEVMRRMRCSIGLIAMFMEYNRCLQTPEKDSFV